LYEYFSEKLGFRFLEGPGKVMGLAPYGKAHPEIEYRFRNALQTTDVFELNLKTLGVRFSGSRINYIQAYRRMVDYVVGNLDLTWNPRAEINSTCADIAWMLQEISEQTVVALARIAREEAGEPMLAMAGGVALNAKANMKIRDGRLFSDLFVFPAAGDSGTAVGAAAYVSEAVLGKKMETRRLTNVYLGPRYSDDELLAIMKSRGLKGDRIGDDGFPIAERVSKGEIVCVYQGRAELGPRALGNRSIVADPRKAENSKRVNGLKGREWWRPLAPSVLQEDLSRYFMDPAENGFMTELMRLTKEGRAALPAVAHVDGTTRPQSVVESENSIWHDAIREFKNITGVGAILNTSFNLAGEPIVETPDEALRSFTKGDFDALYFQGWIIERDSN